MCCRKRDSMRQLILSVGCHVFWLLHNLFDACGGTKRAVLGKIEIFFITGFLAWKWRGLVLRLTDENMEPYRMAICAGGANG